MDGQSGRRKDGRTDGTGNCASPARPLSEDTIYLACLHLLSLRRKLPFPKLQPFQEFKNVFRVWLKSVFSCLSFTPLKFFFFFFPILIFFSAFGIPTMSAAADAAASDDCLVVVVGGDVVGGGSIVLVFTAGHVQHGAGRAPRPPEPYLLPLHT